MDANDSDQLQFRGQDATECKNFIAALIKLAFAQGKQRDDQWIADLAATCMADDALLWWGMLDEEVQSSWKLLRLAMISKYRSRFCGGSGEEAENFIRVVSDKAMDEGKRNDNEWIIAYAESCLAGEALRWYAQLDSDTQENWKKLQKALLNQYPRDGTNSPALNLVPTPPAAAPLAPTPKLTRRGRIRVSNGDSSTPHYLSKILPSSTKMHATATLADALELEWRAGSGDLSTLSIPGSQIPGYDLLGLKWNLDNPRPASAPGYFLGLCPVNSQTNSTPISGLCGNMYTHIWAISTKTGRSDGLLTLSAKTEKETRYARWNSHNCNVWFSERALADRKYEILRPTS